MEGPSPKTEPVNDPPSAAKLHIFGTTFLIFTIFIFYLLVTTWPVLVPDPGAGPNKFNFKPFRFLALGPYDWAPDLRMLLTVIIAGAIGSLIHTLTSFGDYVGNRRLSASWMWWFVLRTPIGIALAIISYLILRGGLIVPTLQTPKDGDLQGATLLLNPYGIAAFAALAGMFSRQATDKLREVFETVFTAQKAVPRGEPLKGKPGVNVEPKILTKGKPEVLTVTGSGFHKTIKATIGGKPRDLQWVSDTEIKVTTVAEDVAKVGKLELVLKNPSNDTFETAIDVIEQGAAAPGVKPVISSTDPADLAKGSPKSLTVNGKNFQAGCTAAIDGEARTVTPGDDKKITITLLDKDIAGPGKLKLIVKNPGVDGQASDVHSVAVR